MENSTEVPQKKVKLELPYGSEMVLLGTYPEKTIIKNDTCSPMFIAGLLAIAKTWKELNAHRQKNG